MADGDSSAGTLTAAPAARGAIVARLSSLLGPYRVLRGNLSLDLLVSSQASYVLGDWLYLVALTVLVYNISHSATLVALLTFVRLLPYALLLPVAGMVVDTWDRRRLLIGAGLARAICMAGLMLIHAGAALALAFVLVFLVTALSSLQRPALNALIPNLVAPDEQVQAYSLVSQMESMAHVVGTVLAALLVLAGALQFAFLIATALLVFACVALFKVRIPAHPPQLAIERPAETGWLNELAAGFRFLIHDNEGVLAACALTVTGLTLLGGAYWALAVVLSVQAFHLGGQGFGFLEAAYGVGGLAGGMLVVTASRHRALGQLLMAGAAAISLSAILFGVSPAGLLPFVFMLAMGVGDVFAEINGSSILQSGAPGELLGRVFAAFEAICVAGMLLGALVVGPLVGVLGARGATVAIALVGFVVLLVCLPRLRRVESVLGVRVFLRQVPILTTLSLRLLDDLAVRLEHACFPAATTIVRQGEVGDRLYIVKSGTLEVITVDAGGGELVKDRIAQRDYFGEIALLRDVPRTATVRTCEAVELYCLTRESFQHVVQRSAPLHEALLESADARYRNTPPPRLIRR